MKAQLTQYVNLLFAGVPNAEDIKQEILQNTLDRYDDLLSQGKTPQAAYSLAISGIGDINEILSDIPAAEPGEAVVPQPETVVPMWKRVMKAAAICLYIICPIPLIVLAEMGLDVFGLCGTLAIVAVATALICIAGMGGKPQKEKADEKRELTPQQELRKAINSIIWAVGLCGYFVISFLTQAWHITWVIFVIIPAAEGLVRAIFDLKEAK